MKRIFDDPNHPQYGPVRRLWVILAQLDLLVSAEVMPSPWDQRLASLIERGMDEAPAQRKTLRLIMEKC